MAVGPSSPSVLSSGEEQLPSSSLAGSPSERSSRFTEDAREVASTSEVDEEEPASSSRLPQLLLLPLPHLGAYPPGRTALAGPACLRPLTPQS